MSKVTSTIRTAQKRKDGKYNIKISIFHNNDTRFIGTKFNVLKSQFSMKDGRVRKSHPLASFINAELKILESRYETKILQMKNIENLTVSQLISMLEKKQQVINLCDLFDDRIAELKNQPSKTWEIYTNTLVNIKKFTSRDFISMSEIDELFLNEFLNWHLDKGNSINSAGIDLRNIRAIFNRAIDNRLITADIYPFRKFKIPSKKTRKRSLVPEHIKKIYAAELKGKQAQARDIFMLVFFLIGINLKDLYNLKPDNIEGERLVYERAKTHKQYSIFIHPEAMEIINRYRDEDDVRLLSFYKQYSRPYEFVKATNKFLDKFIPGLGINDKVTSYYARHSWATIAYNIGIDKDTVRLALGHGAESVTDTYIDFDLKLVDAANRKVIDSII